MEQKERRRSTGKVDRLPPELKDTVEQMLLTGCTYKEIVTFLKENGEEMSQMAICTYAKKYLATVEMITVAQSNFSMLMDEMNRYPDLDTSEALIRLATITKNLYINPALMLNASDSGEDIKKPFITPFEPQEAYEFLKEFHEKYVLKKGDTVVVHITGSSFYIAGKAVKA